MAVLERQTVIVTKDKDGNTVMHFPVTSAKYVEGAVRSVNGNEPDKNGDVIFVAPPVGTVIAVAGNYDPDGYILCNGATVSRTTYANLFAKIGTTYGTGDGSTTFALPNLTDKFIQGSGTAGTIKVAGLPNITGNFGLPNAGFAGNDGMTGAFFGSKENDGRALVVDTDLAQYVPYAQLGFNASRCSSIYGASTSVQPPAVTMRYYIKY